MSKIGNWGQYLKFQTSDDRILTFDNMKHSIKARTQTHNVAFGKPKLEFLGTDLETVTFTIELLASHYRRPIKVEERLLNYMKDGVYAYLIIGGKVILRNAIITSISSKYDVVIKKGKIFSMKLDISMTEYN